MSDLIIKKNGTDYKLPMLAEHYPADRVYLHGDIEENVEDAISLTSGEISSFNTFWYRQGNIVNIVAPNAQRTATQYQKIRGIPTPVKSYLFNESNIPTNLFMIAEDSEGGYIAPQYALNNTWSAFSLTYVCKD